MSEVKIDRVYSITELGGDDVPQGNYINPANYKVPSFCDSCPLAEDLECPVISQVQGLHPVNEGGLIHIGPFRDYVSDVLILHDSEDSGFEPVYLGKVPIISPYSVEHESGDSQVLGSAHQLVDRCTQPGVKKKLFGEDKAVCQSGLAKVNEYRRLGYRLVVDRSELDANERFVVGPDTEGRIEEYVESAKQRLAEGRSLREPTYDLAQIEAISNLGKQVVVATQ